MGIELNEILTIAEYIKQNGLEPIICNKCSNSADYHSNDFFTCTKCMINDFDEYCKYLQKENKK